MNILFATTRNEHLDDIVKELLKEFKNISIIKPAEKKLNFDDIRTIEYPFGKFFDRQKTDPDYFEELNRRDIDTIIIPIFSKINNFNEILDKWRNIFDFISILNFKKIVIINLNNEKITLSYKMFFLRKFIYKFRFLFAPLWVIQGIYKDFFSSFSGNKDFMGFEKNFSISLYYKVACRKMEDFGILGNSTKSDGGLANNLYMCSIIKWLINKIQYKNYLFLCLIVFSLSIIYTAVIFNNYWFILLLPFILNSQYFKNSYIQGHPIIIAWGLFLFSFSFIIQKYLFLSAIFLSIIIILRINAGFLCWVCANLLIILSSNQLMYDILFYNAVITLATGWWILPFLLNLDLFGGIKPLENKNFKYQFTTKLLPLFLNMLYSLIGFSIVYLIFSPDRPAVLLLVPLTIVTLIILRRKSYIGYYTTSIFILVIGYFIINFKPNFFTVIGFLGLIHFSKKNNYDYSFSFGRKYYFDKQNVKHLLDKIESLAINSRIILEIDKNFSHLLWAHFFDYLFYDHKVEVYPGTASLEGSFDIGLKCYTFTNELSHEKISDLLDELCISHIIVISKEMKEKLLKLGCQEIFKCDYNDFQLECLPRVFDTMYIFEYPTQKQIIRGIDNFTTRPNNISFFGEKNKYYIISYAYFRGWRAYQNNMILPIENVKTGMKIYSPENGLIELKYQYRNYYSLKSYFK